MEWEKAFGKSVIEYTRKKSEGFDKGDHECESSFLKDLFEVLEDGDYFKAVMDEYTATKVEQLVEKRLIEEYENLADMFKPEYNYE